MLATMKAARLKAVTDELASNKSKLAASRVEGVSALRRAQRFARDASKVGII